MRGHVTLRDDNEGMVQVVAVNERNHPEIVTSTSTPGSKLMLVCTREHVRQE